MLQRFLQHTSFFRKGNLIAKVLREDESGYLTLQTFQCAQIQRVYYEGYFVVVAITGDVAVQDRVPFAEWFAEWHMVWDTDLLRMGAQP